MPNKKVKKTSSNINQKHILQRQTISKENHIIEKEEA